MESDPHRLYWEFQSNRILKVLLRTSVVGKLSVIRFFAAISGDTAGWVTAPRHVDHPRGDRGDAEFLTVDAKNPATAPNRECVINVVTGGIAASPNRSAERWPWNIHANQKPEYLTNCFGNHTLKVWRTLKTWGPLKPAKVTTLITGAAKTRRSSPKL
ncbi:MAG: hypothetical protein ACREAC_04240 [Blastocatellia bacterium]